MSKYYKIYTARAPVNIALIKYWGKIDEALKIPLNDSVSGTLNIDDLCATTSAAISSSFHENELWLNGSRCDISATSSAGILLEEVKKLSPLEDHIKTYAVHIVSRNNFPTAAGLASSAAGYACLAFVLGNLFAVTDPTELSKLARRGSGSACRSLFGGFVHWHGGRDHDTSLATQIVDQDHWPDMRVIVCVINDQKKTVSSSLGMTRSVQTSALIQHRANHIVGKRVEDIRSAIVRRDFELFANITMQDSNQFHAICLDTFPPIFYLNDTSRMIIKLCTSINSHYNMNKVAYTFDAGPNACIYLLETFVPIFIHVIKKFFPNESGFTVKGLEYGQEAEVTDLCMLLRDHGVEEMPESIKYLIYTSIGSGPQPIPDHMTDDRLTIGSR